MPAAQLNRTKFKDVGKAGGSVTARSRFWKGLSISCLLGLAQCTQTEEQVSKPAFTPVLSTLADSVRAFLARAGGGPGAKLVFVDKTGPEGALRFIDFSEPGTPIRTLAAAKDPALPVLSPDGNWVVYGVGSGCEAGSVVTQRCSVYLSELREDATPLLLARDSACEPRFAPAQGKLSVVYATLAPNFAWEGHGRTLRIDIDVSGPAPVPGAPQELAQGGYTAGLSADGRFLAGGGGHVAMLDLQGKARPETLSYGLIQSCNASISPGRKSDALMYLNTSGSHPALNGGKTWGEWQMLLIGDRQKRLLKGYAPPAGFAHPLETVPPSLSASRWHHSEWSNHPHFAVATLNADRYFKQGAGYANTMFQERIYLINLKDSAYLEALRPERIAYAGKALGGLYWPWLWVETPAGFQEGPDWLAPLPNP